MTTTVQRVFNFSAGPAVLPLPVLEEAQRDLIALPGVGMSVLEISHRSRTFEDILARTEADVRARGGVPPGYSVLFLQGGASLQNTMIPMNLLGSGSADYVVTGTWGKKSAEASALVGKTNVVYDGKAHNYSEVPDLASLPVEPGGSYLHFTSNETVQGVEFFKDPVLPLPVVCDMSSDILSRPVDVSRYALIYAGAQKNMGPAGVALVIVREDLLERTPANFHPMLDYRLMAENDSLYNTPPTWTIYMCGLTYQWVKRQGGLTEMNARNRKKAQTLYDAIDGSGGFYTGHAKASCRSIMNVTFRLPSEDLTDQFVKEAQALKLDGLKGHRSVGGCRASIYNAFPAEGCTLLAEFMGEFARRNG